MLSIANSGSAMELAMLMEHLKVHWQDVEGTGGSAIGTAEESIALFTAASVSGNLGLV